MYYVCRMTLHYVPEREYLLRCACGVCVLWILGLFRRPVHPEAIRGNGNVSEPTKYHLQLLSRWTISWRSCSNT